MRVLIYRSGGIGDQLAALSVAAACREHECMFAGSPAVACLAAGVGLIAGWTDANGAALAPLFTAHPHMNSLPECIRQSDVLLLFCDRHSPLPAACAQVLPGRVQQIDPLPPAPVSVYEWYVRQIRMSGLNPHLPQWPFLGQGPTSGSLPATRLVVLHPGSGSSRKNWPLHNFIRVGRFLEDRDLEPVWVRGEAETRLPSIDNEWAVKRNRPLSEIADLLRHSVLYIGNDSGIAHLAAAVGVPSVLVFGPSDPRIWAPPAPYVRVTWSRPGCGPCHPRGPGCEQARCMAAIDPGDVCRIAWALYEQYRTYS